MIALKYTIFAIISTIVNLFFQWFSFLLYSGFASLYVAMVFGTLAGLVAKYILDKKWIFYHTPKDKKDDAKKFILYSLMGVLTTLIFWGFEIVFDYFWDLKYIGAVMGLAIGYFAKYHLDKQFVFIDKR